MGDKEDYLTQYRVFFESFAATVNPEDQLPVQIAGYTITEEELPGEVLYWITQYLTEKQCPASLMTPLRRIILEDVRTASKKQPNEFGYNSDDSVYIALRLMQAVTARVNDVCLRHLDNARLDSLPPPPRFKEMKTVSAAAKNSRRAMEDRHVEIGNLEALFGIDTTEPTSFYAVYDGHAGSAAATYCAAHLHQYLVESPHFTTDLRKALRDAYLRTDSEFVKKSNQARANGGSTAVSVAVRGRQLHAAWAGDSLALLAKRMRLMQLVRPHKPSRQDEKSRIEASGGAVMFWGTWRVNGQLAVSRAIGDAPYKPYVTARPELATVDLDGDEDFIVIACDGLWDFVSEDDVALSVYRQLAADPNDLKAVTKQLIVQAKRQGSCDNISIIVVFLKEPRDIAADNRPPMDLGLDNALTNAPPFVGDVDACKRTLDSTETDPVAMNANIDLGNGVEINNGMDINNGVDNGNGIDNSESDSEDMDLGPETAVDDADARPNDNEQHTIPDNVDGGGGDVEECLVDNVAESGEESEDEWNYFKGEGQQGSEPAQEPASELDAPSEPDDIPTSETPCQDNSAWETSSVDMNSSPLNPDAPVFVPGTVAGSDVLLAESPRKPLPMDDIELPDVSQFQTEAINRPAGLLDLDNNDQLNGHHNISIDGSKSKEHLNGNDKCTMDSLGFGFSVGVDTDKVKDNSLIQDFERIQKDTTDFCNIQVFQAHTETNPFAMEEGNEELLERLKNKERDPMNMSFYQEKDDDTCERLREPIVDLNAVQLLPDSDDDEMLNGDDKENVFPESQAEPNNDIINLDEQSNEAVVLDLGMGNNFGYGSGDHARGLDFESAAAREPVLPTDTPESHKLLFEQIPEIPDGKSSELGFGEDTPHEIEDDELATPLEHEERNPKNNFESEEINVALIEPKMMHAASPGLQILAPAGEDDITAYEAPASPAPSASPSPAPPSPMPAASSSPAQDSTAQVHRDEEPDDVHIEHEDRLTFDDGETELEAPELLEPELGFECSRSPIPTESLLQPASPAPSRSPAIDHSPLPSENIQPSPSPLPSESRFPTQSPLTSESLIPSQSPVPSQSPIPNQSPMPCQSPSPSQSPLPSQSPIPSQELPSSAILLSQTLEQNQPADFKEKELQNEFVPSLSPLRGQSPLPNESSLPQEASHSPLQSDEIIERHVEPCESPAPAFISPQIELSAPVRSPTPAQSPVPAQNPSPSPAPSEPVAYPEPAASPAPLAPAPDLVTDVDVPTESHAQEICVPVTCELAPEEPAPETQPLADTPIAAEPAAAAAVVAAVALGAAAAAAVGANATAKTKTPAKKPTTATKTSTHASKTTPRPSTTTHTPASATKKPAPAAPTGPKTSTSAPKAPAARTTAARPASAAAPASRVSATRSTTASRALAAPASRSTASKETSAPGRPAAAPRAAAPRAPAAAKPSARPAPASSARPATAPSARPATAPSARPVPARPAPRAAAPRPALASAKPAAAADREPLSNGDVKTEARKPLAAPRAPIRAAPRPAPAPAKAPVTARSTEAKPAAPRAPRPALEKQTKDLANKRITAKTAPPRTTLTKVPPSNKNNAKVAVKKKEVKSNGVEPAKGPPSPGGQDAASLPDVIA